MECVSVVMRGEDSCSITYHTRYGMRAKDA